MPEPLARRTRARFDGANGITRPPASFDLLDHLLRDASEQGHEVRCHDDALACIAVARGAVKRQVTLQRAYSEGGRAAGPRALLKVPLDRL